MNCFIYNLPLLVAIFSCHQKARPEAFAAKLNDVPACIQSKIDSIKQRPVGNPPTEISEYVYASRKVYLISAQCCDMFTVAVDSNCNYICAPAGGFTGKGDRKCLDFLEKAKYVRLVWKDERAKK